MPTAPRTDLHSRLLQLCDEFRAQGDIDCEVALDERHTRFDEEVSEVVFRTVRELLTNVRQHAKAKQVKVSSVGRRDGSIGITVADDGIGLPPHRRRGNPFDETAASACGASISGCAASTQSSTSRQPRASGTRAMVILPGNLVVAD